jgi:pilus assembly protein CpaB
MRLTTIIIVVAALAVSVLTAFMIQWYLGSRAPSSKTVREIIPAERVLVAKKDITGGTVMKKKEHFSWQAWPKSGLRKEFILKGSGLDKEFEGAILRHDTKSGLPLTADSMYRGGEKGFVASGLKPGMRAVSVKIDPVIGVSGFIRAGDRVDIILTTTLTIPDKEITRQLRNSTKSRKVSETILRNVRVIAINQNAESSAKNQKKPKLATFEVTEKQAEILANARRMGKLFLVLRSHVAALEKPKPRKYQFTTDLEIMSAMRGGLASHIDDINRSALTEFGLDRWIAGTPDVKPVVKPKAEPAVKKLPKIVKRSPPRPKTMVRPQPKPEPAAKKVVPPAPVSTLKKPAPTGPSAIELKLQALEKKLKEQEKKLLEATRPVKPAAKKIKPVKVVAPVKPKKPKKPRKPKKVKAVKAPPKTTVRVDRAGAVQILKFKAAQ